MSVAGSRAGSLYSPSIPRLTLPSDAYLPLQRVDPAPEFPRGDFDCRDGSHQEPQDEGRPNTCSPASRDGSSSTKTIASQPPTVQEALNSNRKQMPPAYRAGALKRTAITSMQVFKPSRSCLVGDNGCSLFCLRFSCCSGQRLPLLMCPSQHLTRSR